MTLKRKIGITAVLVVVVASVLAAVLSGHESNPLIVAMFVRYEGGSNALIQIENKSGSNVYFDASEAPVKMALMSEPLAPRQIRQVRVKLWPADPSKGATIGVACLRISSTPERALRWLLSRIRISQTPNQWIVSLDLPPPNPPLP